MQAWLDLRLQVERRPVVVLALTLGLGLASRQVLGAFIVGLIVLAMVFPSRAAGFGGVTLVIGWMLAPAPPTARLVETQPFVGQVTVRALPVLSNDGYSLLVDSLGARYWLRLKGQPRFNSGDLLWVVGDAEPLSESAGTSRGAIGSLQPQSVRELRTGPEFWNVATRVSTSFRNWALESLSPAAAKLIIAITFNQTDKLLLSDWEILQDSGLIHVVSASGFHVLIVGIAVAWALKWIALPRPWVLSVTALVLLLYAAAAGFQAPVVRAVVMIVILEFAYWFRKCPDGLSALGVGAIVNLGIDPYVVFELGFHLSVLSVAGLAVFTPQFFGQGPSANPRSLSQAVKTPIIAQLVTAPLSTLRFGSVSLMAIPLNALLSPLIAYLTVAALVLWVSASLAEPVVALTTPILLEKPMEFLLWFASWSTSWPGAIFYPFAWSGWMTAVAQIGILLLWRPKREAHDQ